MRIDLHAQEAAFEDGQLPREDLNELLGCLRRHLGYGAERSWRLISARKKLGNALFEIEESGPQGTRRYIGKTGREERVQTQFQALRELHEAGFRPPSEFTVAEPIAYLPERNCILVEKAPGVAAMDTILAQAQCARSAVLKCAQWAAALHASGLEPPRWSEDVPRLQRWSAELQESLPEYAARFHQVVERVLPEIARTEESALVPCHGDFHPINILVASSGRVTAIDLDKFATRDRHAEIGYCLGQVASIGFHRLGSFGATAELRSVLLQAYETRSGVVLDRLRTGVYMAFTFIAGLHYLFVAFKKQQANCIEPWLDAAARCLEGGIELP